MKKNDVMKILETAENNDITMWEYKNVIHATIEDFEGFDENWDEVDREYDEEKVTAILSELEENAIQIRKGYYTEYVFEDCTVKVGYASFDI